MLLTLPLPTPVIRPQLRVLTVQPRIQLGTHIVVPGPSMRQTHRARRRERQQLGTQHITEPIERTRLTVGLHVIIVTGRGGRDHPVHGAQWQAGLEDLMD